MSSLEQLIAACGPDAEFMNWDEEIMALEARETSASAARFALEATRCVENVARKAGYAASRAEGKRNRLQFTGGHYVCPGPLPGVSCTNKYGTRQQQKKKKKVRKHTKNPFFSLCRHE